MREEAFQFVNPSRAARIAGEDVVCGVVGQMPTPSQQAAVVLRAVAQMIERVAVGFERGVLVARIAGQPRQPVERAKQPLLVGQIAQHPLLAIGPLPFHWLPRINIESLHKQRRGLAIDIAAMRQHLIGELANGGEKGDGVSV